MLREGAGLGARRRYDLHGFKIFMRARPRVCEQIADDEMTVITIIMMGRRRLQYRRQHRLQWRRRGLHLFQDSRHAANSDGLIW